jgi:plastocyanin
MKFVPETLTVRRGDTVRWVNQDFFPHTATAQDGSFDSRDIGIDRTWVYVATQDGTFAYICTLHPGMKGTLIVK